MAQANQRHSGTDRLASQLIFAMPLLPDELLSSWLVRLARANGFDPLALTEFIWPKWRVWIRDIDRGVDPERERQASAFLGVPVALWQSATLREIAFQVGGGLPARPGVWPWILAIGARNRRRSGGLQYCSKCLATDPIPYFRLYWRLSWHTACERHSIFLRDSCPSCGSPLEPHRLGLGCDHLARCVRCAADFTTETISENANPELLCFQGQADAAVSGGEAMFQGRCVSTKLWFETAAFLTALVRREQCGNSKALTALLTTMGARSTVVPVRVGAGIEKLRLEERKALFFSTAKLMSCDGQRFTDALQSSGASQQCLYSLGMPIPDVLRQSVDALPRHNVKRRRGGSVRSRLRLPSEVQRMMISLERRMLATKR